MMGFAERLAARRKELGLTQQALADLALRVSDDYLLFDEDERAPADELKMQFEAVSRLEPAERRVIQEVVQSILLTHDAKRWIRSATEAAAAAEQ